MVMDLQTAVKRQVKECLESTAAAIQLPIAVLSHHSNITHRGSNAFHGYSSQHKKLTWCINYHSALLYWHIPAMHCCRPNIPSLYQIHTSHLTSYIPPAHVSRCMLHKCPPSPLCSPEGADKHLVTMQRHNDPHLLLGGCISGITNLLQAIMLLGPV